VNSDEGWEMKNRSNITGKIVPSAAFGGSDAGIKAMIAKVHGMGLKMGLYGAASGVTCGNMPGNLYHETLDAETYASWGLDYLKSDNCATYALDSSVRFVRCAFFQRKVTAQAAIGLHACSLEALACV
jgi:alpha-galactosidase